MQASWNSNIIPLLGKGNNEKIAQKVKKIQMCYLQTNKPTNQPAIQPTTQPTNGPSRWLIELPAWN